MDKKLFTALAFAYKTLDYEKDPNPDNWITIKGTHTHLEGGKINGGAGGKFNGKGYTGTKKQAHTGKSNGENTQTENKADLEKRLKELKSKSDSLYWTITRSDSANKTTSAGKELAKVGAEIKEVEKKLGKRREFHELTKEQARRAHGMPENKHKERVEKALKEGKTVPENVLADYPDLKEKYGKKEPAAKKETKSPAASEKLSKIAAEYKKYDTDIAKYAGQMAKIAEKDGEDAALAWANKKMQEISESDMNPVAKGYHRGRLKRVLEEYEGKGPVMKAQAKEPKLGAPKSAEEPTSKGNMRENLKYVGTDRVAQVLTDFSKKEKNKEVKQWLDWLHKSVTNPEYEEEVKRGDWGDIKGDTSALGFLTATLNDVQSATRSAQKYNNTGWLEVYKKEREVLKSMIKQLNDEGAQKREKKEKWRREHVQLKLFDRKPKR